MTVTILPGPAAGTLAAIPSKSAAHRLLIAAALADRPTRVRFPKSSQDIEATLRCLAGLGAGITREKDGCLVVPILPSRVPACCELDCGESGSTLRFLAPLAGALGTTAVFRLSGRLSRRPMEPLAGQLAAHGCVLTADPEAETLTVSGRLRSGTFTLPGNVSSQFFTGLLFALPLLKEESILLAEGELESAGYLDLTRDALARFGVVPETLSGGWRIPPCPYRTPGTVIVEGDWSNAAPWLCMGILGGPGVSVTGLAEESLQGDRAVCRVLAGLGGEIGAADGSVFARPRALVPGTIDARNIPDLVPVLAAAASVIPGETRIVNAARLRLKESDRLETTARLLNALGGQAEETADGLILRGVPRLAGGTVDAAGDHRIVMAAAVASVLSAGPVTVTGAQAVDKSYPSFWEDLRALGKPAEAKE